MAKLTKGQRLLLALAVNRNGPLHVYPDQASEISKLERAGFMEGNGKHLDRESTITDAGRRALAEGGRNNE